MRPRALSLVTAAAALALLIPALAAAEARTYSLDRSHSKVSFTIRHLMSEVDGRFRDFDGSITYDPQAPEKSAVEVTVQAASIDTANQRRDDHLRSPDFFEAEKHPTLSFKSTTVERESESALRVTGDLSIRGVTKQVTIPVRITGAMPYRGGEKVGFASDFTVDRKDFGVTWNRAVDQGGVLLGDDVAISIRVEADWAPPQPAATAAPSGR
jgi:polyisoprenoid-binding protein YceI